MNRSAIELSSRSHNQADRESSLAGSNMKKLTLVLVSSMAVLLSACGGGGAHVQSQVTTVSKGQQLIDLKKAVDDGALTQDEYNKEKSKILGEPN